MTTATCTHCATEVSNRTKHRAGSDLLLRVGVRITVAALAAVAAASSFGHMQALALRHGQDGWQSLAFPLSVDGLELTATLVLLAEHRAKGKATSLLPWTALVIGTAASIGANIAVGPPDFLGRCVSGWPGLALIASLKLLTMTLTTTPAASPRTVHAANATPAASLTLVPNITPAEPATAPASLSAVATPADDAPQSGDDAGGLHDTDQVPDDPEVEGEADAPHTRDDASPPDSGTLIEHSRAVRDRLQDSGQNLTRRELVSQLRTAGYAVSNKRAGELLRALRGDDSIAHVNGARFDGPGAEHAISSAPR